MFLGPISFTLASIMLRSVSIFVLADAAARNTVQHTRRGVVFCVSCMDAEWIMRIDN